MMVRWHSCSRVSYILLLGLLPIFLTACGTASGPRGGAIGSTRDGAPSHKVDVTSIPDAVPRAERRSKYGNPTTYTVAGKAYRIMSDSEGYVESGVASWYGTKFHGRRTSSGEPYDMHAMTAAHKTLPLPTYAEVTNLQNGRKVIVKINDRGPFHDNRLIDLSHAAASKLDILATGTGLVEVRAITPGTMPKCSGCKDAQELPPGTMPKCSGWSFPASLPPTTLVLPCTSQDAQTPDAVVGDAVDDESGTVKLYLQAGAFSRRGNAERLRARINEVAIKAVQGNVHIIEREAERSARYRVRIGPFTSVGAVDRFTSDLRRMGIPDAKVVID